MISFTFAPPLIRAKRDKEFPNKVDCNMSNDVHYNSKYKSSINLERKKSIITSHIHCLKLFLLKWLGNANEKALS